MVGTRKANVSSEFLRVEAVVFAESPAEFFEQWLIAGWIRDSHVVDRMDDAIWKAYGAASAPAFVIGAGGRVVARQVWSDPGAFDEVLEDLVSPGGSR